MKHLRSSLIIMLCTVVNSQATAITDTLMTPSIIHLAKVSPKSSNTKIWVAYNTPSDLVKLEQEGFKILKTKIKMVRDNQFWSDILQSSLNMAMGYIILKGGPNANSKPIPVSFSKPEQYRFH